jgi:hypothetical protein
MSDVYASGITLLNLVRGPLHTNPKKYTVVWHAGFTNEYLGVEFLLDQSRILLRKNNLKECIDLRIDWTITSATDANEVMRIALLCCQRGMIDQQCAKYTACFSRLVAKTTL